MMKKILMLGLVGSFLGAQVFAAAETGDGVDEVLRAMQNEEFFVVKGLNRGIGFTVDQNKFLGIVNALKDFRSNQYKNLYPLVQNEIDAQAAQTFETVSGEMGSHGEEETVSIIAPTAGTRSNTLMDAAFDVLGGQAAFGTLNRIGSGCEFPLKMGEDLSAAVDVLRGKQEVLAKIVNKKLESAASAPSASVSSSSSSSSSASSSSSSAPSVEFRYHQKSREVSEHMERNGCSLKPIIRNFGNSSKMAWLPN